MEWISVVFWLTGTLIVVLGPIVLIHELGHFISAKLAGVRVEEFGFGFPPRMLKLWHGEGYLDIGSTRVAIPRRAEIRPPGGLRLPPNLLTGAHVDALAQRQEDGTYVLCQVNVLDSEKDDVTPKQEQAGEGIRMRGEVTDIERGTLYSLNWLPMGAFVKMTGEEDPTDPRSLAAQPKRWRLAVMGAGVALNIVAAFLLIVGAYVSGAPCVPVQIDTVVEGSAAVEAGLLPQDVILTIDGERIEEGVTQVQRIIQAAPERTVELTILRGDETLSMTATPRPRHCEDAEAYCQEGSGFLGIVMSSSFEHLSVRRYSLPEAMRAGVNHFGTIIKMIVSIPGQLVRGEMKPEEARPTSVVGAGQILTFSLQQSIEMRLAFPVLQTASLISLALGLTNILPLPALDGGRILFVLIEALRGRRFPPEHEAVIHFVGLVIMIFLMTLVMLYDIFSPVIPWSLLMK